MIISEKYIKEMTKLFVIIKINSKQNKNNRFAVQQLYSFRVYIVIKNGHNNYNDYVKFKFNDISLCKKNDLR